MRAQFRTWTGTVERQHPRDATRSLFRRDMDGKLYSIPTDMLIPAEELHEDDDDPAASR